MSAGPLFEPGNEQDGLHISRALGCDPRQLLPIGDVHSCQRVVLDGESEHVVPPRFQRNLAVVGQEDVECGHASILKSDAHVEADVAFDVAGETARLSM